MTVFFLRHCEEQSNALVTINQLVNYFTGFVITVFLLYCQLCFSIKTFSVSKKNELQPCRKIALLFQ